MKTDEAGPTATAHRRCSALLRRWLSETHTPTRAGPLQLDVGPVRVCTDVRYESPTGAHGFGPIRVSGGGDSAVCEPDTTEGAAGLRLLAAAISADARARAATDAPVGAAGGSLTDRMLRALNEPEWALDPLGGFARSAGFQESVKEPAGRPPGILDSITGRDEYESWLDGHLATELMPALEMPHRSEANVTAALLARGPLAVIGLLGRYGVAGEPELLTVLSHRLRSPAQPGGDAPVRHGMVQHWLTSPTLTDFAGLNGSGLRYRGRSDGACAAPLPYEIPNPLTGSSAAAASVPGVPVPALESDWSLRPVELAGDDGGPDAALVQAWMSAAHVADNWEQAWPLPRWHRELADQLGGDHSLPCIVSRAGRPIAYVELYRVARDVLSRCYPFHPHDLGVHIAIGEPDAVGRGFGSWLLRALAEGLLNADPGCRRVVAEPNVHNGASIGAFTKAGFAREREVGLPSKNSALMVYPRRPGRVV